MYYLFLDESGDHGLSNINEFFPVFVLCGVLIQSDDYEHFRDRMNTIKESYWGNKTVIFHSSDIRKRQKEFQILFDLELASNFMNDINAMIKEENFTIIADGIQKVAYINRYGKLSKVYELCLSYVIERAVFFLDKVKDNGSKKMCIVIEERGKKENRQLQEYFDKIMARGTAYVSAERLRALGLRIEFRKKSRNVNGLQLADLVAYPIARHIIDKERANPAFDILYEKIYQADGKLYGLKTYP